MFYILLLNFINYKQLIPYLFYYSCDFNQYTLAYLKRMGEIKQLKNSIETEDMLNGDRDIEEMEIDQSIKITFYTKKV